MVTDSVNDVEAEKAGQGQLGDAEVGHNEVI
jgi:hypothetical protein